MNIDQFRAEIAKYQKQLAQPIPTEMNLCIEKISQLGAIHYRTGYLLANARRFLRKVKEEKTHSLGLSSTFQFSPQQPYVGLAHQGTAV